MRAMRDCKSLMVFPIVICVLAALVGRPNSFSFFGSEAREIIEEQEVNDPDSLFESDPVDVYTPAEEQLEEVSEEKVEKLPEVIVHTIGKGDTLSHIWTRYTGSHAGALHAAEAFKSVKVSLSTLHTGDELELQLSPEGDITALKKNLGRGRVLFLDGNSQAGYQAKLIEPECEEVDEVITGTISNSLSRDASELGVPLEIVDSFVDLLAGSVDFRRDIHDGDTFSVSYKKNQTKDGDLISVGAIQNASIVVNGKLYAAIGYAGKDGKTRYYDVNGNAIGDYFLRYPVKFTRISSVFTDARQHPILGVKRPHHGIDFAAPVGTPVRSIGSGVVTFAGSSGAAGRMIKIAHNKKYATVYMHLSAIKKGIKNKVHVERGEVIGYVGSTGLSTGPHLDFRFSVNGKYVDPLKANLPTLSNSDDKIPVKYLRAALSDIKQAHDEQHMLVLNR